MNALKHQSPSPIAFFMLLLALGSPIIIFSGVHVFPNVPLFTFGAFLPVTTALILRHREDGNAGMVDLLRRSFDYGRIPSRIWYVPVLFMWPLI